MAVWQWDLWLVPKHKVLEHFSVIPEYVDQDWFESIDWWDDTPVGPLESFFGGLLPPLSGSGWGVPDETFARLTTEDEKITDVFVRIDVRTVESVVLHSLIDFVSDREFLFFSLESNRFIEPDWVTFVRQLKNSRAYRFVDNQPDFFNDQNYLNKLNKEVLRKIESSNDEKLG